MSPSPLIMPTEGEPEPRALPRRRTGEAATLDPAVSVEYLVEALRTGDAAAADRIVHTALAAGLSGTQVQSRLITPAMRQVGSLWADEELSVAEEHVATAVAHQVLARLYPSLQQDRLRGDAVVAVAAPHREQHVLGLRMIADALEGAGFDVRFLGGNLPAHALVEWVAAHRPAVVALGVTMPLTVPRLLRKLHEIHDLDPTIRLVIGGQGVPPALQEIPGVPYVRDTEEVVAAVERTLGDPVPILLPPLDDGSPHLPVEHPGALSPVARLAEINAATAEAAREQARRAYTLEQLAFRDPLTGLWNRRALDDRLRELVSDQGDRPPAMLMIDVDHFKAVNDTLGHDVGDQVLIAVGRAISGVLRPDDFPARYGGDEFAVLLPAATAQDASAVAERIRAAVESEWEEPRVSVSVGVAIADVSEPGRLRLDVDRALYAAKRGGRNRVGLPSDETRPPG